MKKFLGKLYRETAIGYLLIHPAILLYKFYLFRLIPDKTFVKQQFKNALGYELDLNNPQTLNEKIQWLKLNDRNQLQTICADKYAVREYIRNKIGEQYLIPLILKTEKITDIFPENLPDYPFIIKTNHDSSGGIIVRDKSKIDWQNVRRKLAINLKNNYYYFNKEWQYKHIKPCIIVEKLLLDGSGSIPSDYKLHCFNGKLAFVQVDIDRQTDHRRSIYDPHWNLLDCQWLYQKGGSVAKPISFNKMSSLAEEIARDFCYVRVDFYNLNGEIYFGELTFHPGSGIELFTPFDWDKKFGAQLNLSQVSRTF